MTEQELQTMDLGETLRRIEDVLEQIPVPIVREQVREKLAELRELLVEKRNPRVALIGRRGAGKSSLVNALFGEEVAKPGHVEAETMTSTWRTLRSDGGELEILDTRGLQEGADGSASAEQDVGADPALVQLLDEFRKTPPDVLLFLVKAKEVDAGIDGDLARLQRIVGGLARAGIDTVPLLGVVTQCDELEPPDVKLHDPDDEEPEEYESKRALVERAVEMLSKRLRALDGVEVIRVMGTCSYMRWGTGGKLRRDHRWNIDVLQQALFQELPRSALYEFVRLAQLRHLKVRLARVITEAFAMIAVGVAAVPTPVADTIPLIALQGAMILSIARLDSPLNTMRDVGSFMGALGVGALAGLAAREGFRALIQVVPGWGMVLSGAIAWATTRALGAAAIAWFLRNERDQAKLKEEFKVDLQRFRKEAEEDPNLR